MARGTWLLPTADRPDCKSMRGRRQRRRPSTDDHHAVATRVLQLRVPGRAGATFSAQCEQIGRRIPRQRPLRTPAGNAGRFAVNVAGVERLRDIEWYVGTYNFIPTHSKFGR